MVHAPVRNILLETAGNGKSTAVGVVFEYAGKTYSVNALEEVILSAGYVFIFVVFTLSIDVHVVQFTAVSSPLGVIWDREEGRSGQIQYTDEDRAFRCGRKRSRAHVTWHELGCAS